MGFFNKRKDENSKKLELGLTKTRNNFIKKLEILINNRKKIDEEFYDELEEILISADIGINTIAALIEQLKIEISNKKIENATELRFLLAETILNIMEFDKDNNKLNIENDRLNIVLIVGVNGVGKTTSISKLANKYNQEGKKVMIAAGDTFRAGAIEQLEVWGKRIGVNVVKHQAGADPSAVIFDAIKSAKAKNMDLLFCDTAGRLHNKINLMQELNKIFRTIQKEIPDGPHEILLVLDATTGQNALQQAKLFKEAANVTGIVLTKLDGTAKGGIVISICYELGIPVKYVTMGEGIDDLEVFEPKQFINAIFEEEFFEEI